MHDVVAHATLSTYRELSPIEQFCTIPIQLYISISCRIYDNGFYDTKFVLDYIYNNGFLVLT